MEILKIVCELIIPILVFGIAEPENMVRAVKGEKIGTLVE